MRKSANNNNDVNDPNIFEVEEILNKKLINTKVKIANIYIIISILFNKMEKLSRSRNLLGT